MDIGIIGNGFVGKATQLFRCDEINIKVYDKNPDLCEPFGTNLDDLLKCSIIFVSVPTPMNKDGSCCENIVKSVVDKLNNLDYKGFIVIRSTISIGTSDELGCYFMPEFLTEKNFVKDFINNKDWILGLLNDKKDEKFKKIIDNLIQIAYYSKKIKYNNLTYVSNKEAEMIKLMRNNFLATKVSFCNEISEFCEKKNIIYENVRKLAMNDERILHSHSYVPGPDGKRGFGGTCFPKDSNSLNFQMKKVMMNPYISDAIIKRNINIDRKEKDWESDIGRAVIN